AHPSAGPLPVAARVETPPSPLVESLVQAGSPSISFHGPPSRFIVPSYVPDSDAGRSTSGVDRGSQTEQSADLAAPTRPRWRGGYRVLPTGPRRRGAVSVAHASGRRRACATADRRIDDPH